MHCFYYKNRDIIKCSNYVRLFHMIQIHSNSQIYTCYSLLFIIFYLFKINARRTQSSSGKCQDECGRCLSPHPHLMFSLLILIKRELIKFSKGLMKTVVLWSAGALAAHCDIAFISQSTFPGLFNYLMTKHHTFCRSLKSKPFCNTNEGE